MAALHAGCVVVDDPHEARAVVMGLDRLRREVVRDGGSWPVDLQRLRDAFADLTPARNLERNLSATMPSRDVAEVVDRSGCDEVEWSLKTCHDRFGRSVSMWRRLAPGLGGRKVGHEWFVPAEAAAAYHERTKTRRDAA